MFLASHSHFYTRLLSISGGLLLLLQGTACSTSKLPEPSQDPGDLDSNPNGDDDDDIGDDDDDDDDDGATSDPTGDDDDDNDDSAGSDDDDDDDDDDASDPGTDDLDPGAKFDLGQVPDLDSSHDRCPIDFLFVVDNSGSMEDEQKNLTASFPNFIKGIRETVMTDDFQVLVIDSDSNSIFPSICTNGDCDCLLSNDDCCIEACADPANKTCEGNPCSDYPQGSDCDAELGSGRIKSGAGADCMISGDRRFMLGNDPNLEAAFSCAASVGIDGDGDERMTMAMNTALSPVVVGKDGCNEGFLRDETVLVTVMITDEEEKSGQGSMGGPKEWYDTLMAAKGGKKEHVVMIAFIGDTGLPGAICQPFDEDMEVGAEESPRLHEFVELFGATGMAASVCAPDYGPAFTEAIGKIDAACDALTPK